ncbi:solute carrier family 66 (lysosomal lysine-arginine transporter), member 1 [Entomortierella parvispora]|uniref:Solute carrier family 66 (Lysosomal lysine-arginine transporter), member 1 n=1 Tax=Entomortierella parvispora TaxID=205924 RepID=A0A9P3HBF2_9FUNG|nr:solute carrier family 66 (lysosomal lysine-arginine transporter), member 1 [Entomortierella parvispora]
MSLLLGYVSILCWLNAQIPQIIENFKLGSAESLSLPFLINWLLGDISNLIGCILTHQLPFQMYLAIYFCIADIILFGQWIYYSRRDRYKRLVQHDMPDIMVGDLPEISETDHRRHSLHPAPSLSGRPRHSRRVTSATVTAAPAASTTATAIPPLHHDLVLDGGAELGSDLEQAENLSPLMHRPRTRRATTASDISHRRSTSIVLFGVMLFTLRQTWPSDSTLEAHFGSGSLTGSFPVQGRVFARADLSQDEMITDEPTDVNIVQLGRIFAWVCTVFYLSSRMPQLWKNYKRKSVQGLSILMFFWAAMGNLSYTLSILNSREAVDPTTRQKFLREAVPYVLGSSGTLMFDLSIFCQWLYYTGKFRCLDRVLDRVFGTHRSHRRHGPRIGHRHHHARQQGSHPSRLDSMALSPSGSQSGLYNILVDEEDPDLVQYSNLEDPKASKTAVTGGSDTLASGINVHEGRMHTSSSSSSLPAMAAGQTHSP